jgi:ubiquinone/menaquinone biosynthesis C-methylase UbiE
MNLLSFSQMDPREEAYLYDLCVAPLWREAFNQLFDSEIKKPEPGRILDAGCGTGDFSIGLAAGLHPNSSILGIDPSGERIEIARAKARLQKIERLNFQVGEIETTGLRDNEFDLVVGDLSLRPGGDPGAALAELHRVAKPGAVLVALLATRGSFDEFFSVFWESLYDQGIHESTSNLETLITARPTALDAERMASAAGWRRVRSVTQKQRFDFDDASAFLSDPLMGRYFFPEWFGLITDDADRESVRDRLIRIIDRDRHGLPFDVSIKATMIIGAKQTE